MDVASQLRKALPTDSNGVPARASVLPVRFSRIMSSVVIGFGYAAMFQVLRSDSASPAAMAADRKSVV